MSSAASNLGQGLPSVGRCIYCGDTDGPLTKEHVIPKMLRGNVTLPKASCEPCAKITSQIELYAGRQIFQDVRLKLNFPMGKRPTHVPAYKDFNPSPELATPTLVPTTKVPGVLYLLVPEPAGVITGRAPGAEFEGKHFTRIISTGRDDQLGQNREHPRSYRTLETSYVGRLIAKIALGIGVTSCGYDGFRSTISDVILGMDSDWPYWIGGTNKLMDEFPPSSGENVLHRVVAYSRKIDGEPYLAVQMQLLAFLGTPVYTAVVGRLNEVGLSRLFSE